MAICALYLFHQCALRDAQLVRRFERPPYLGAADVTIDRTAVQVKNFRYLIRGFFQKLHPERADAKLHEMVQIFRTRLFNGVVHGVAAAFIDPNGMGHADAVLQGCTLLLAWTAAVRVVRTFAQERTVHAVLRMEHRHMLMDDDFHAWMCLRVRSRSTIC